MCGFIAKFGNYIPNKNDLCESLVLQKCRDTDNTKYISNKKYWIGANETKINSDYWFNLLVLIRLLKNLKIII